VQELGGRGVVEELVVVSVKGWRQLFNVRRRRIPLRSQRQQ
jgi:hypothetical protein